MPSRAGRSEWGARKRSALDGADIVFLDPDNGIGGETEKHATFSEIRLLRKPGRAIVFITFPGRSMKHDALLQQLHKRLAVETDAENIVMLRTNVSVPRTIGSSSYVQRQRWFTVVDFDTELTTRAEAFAAVLAANTARARGIGSRRMSVSENIRVRPRTTKCRRDRAEIGVWAALIDHLAFGIGKTSHRAKSIGLLVPFDAVHRHYIFRAERVGKGAKIGG